MYLSLSLYVCVRAHVCDVGHGTMRGAQKGRRVTSEKEAEQEKVIECLSPERKREDYLRGGRELVREEG